MLTNRSQEIDKRLNQVLKELDIKPEVIKRVTGKLTEAEKVASIAFFPVLFDNFFIERCRDKLGYWILEIPEDFYTDDFFDKDHRRKFRRDFIEGP